jgi:putative glutamine amidotransferase
MARKPLIGITTYFVNDQELTGHRVRGTVGQDMVMSNLDYSRSIDQAEGIPVALPSLESPRAASDLVRHLDGLLLAGGEDIAPALFQQSPQPGLGAVIERRDRYEWALLAAALAKGIPIFGICRGLQLLNVYFGGSLYQDLATYYNNAVPHFSAHLGREALVHEVDLQSGSLLHRCLGEKRIWVNSLHHQGIDRLAADLEPAARSLEGLVEGVQHRSASNVFGVQWHPEMMTERHDIQRKLFYCFVDLARPGK